MNKSNVNKTAERDHVDSVAVLACCWSENSNGAWTTGCGELWELNNGTPKENGMKFCPCCGRKLTESRYVDDIRDEHDDEYVAELAAKQAKDRTARPPTPSHTFNKGTNHEHDT